MTISLRKCVRPPLGLILLVAVSTLLSACASAPQWKSLPRDPSAVPPSSFSSAPPQATATRHRSENEIAPGYIIGLSSSDPKVTGEFRVEFDGSLKLPYQVRVNAAGLSLEQLRKDIHTAYSSYFRNPSEVKVTLKRREYYVSAQGLVKKPGNYVLSKSSSLDEIISLAGGLQEGRSSPHYARISGIGQERLIRLSDYHAGTSIPSIDWQGGETLFFQSESGVVPLGGEAPAKSVRILGEVEKPDDYAIQENGNFFSYLIKAGGPTDRADLGRVTVIRFDEHETRALTFNMYEVEQIPHILPGDAIILNADNASSMEKRSRVGANFANIVSALGLVAIAAFP